MSDIDFTKPFQFTAEERDNSEIFTYEGTDLEGDSAISWGDASPDNRTTYRLSAVRKYIAVGDWVIFEPEPSLQEMYIAENNKLSEQSAKVDALWEMLKAEALLAQNARKALLHAKRVEVDCVRDKMKEASDRYTKVADELDEMLRNEPF